MLKIPVGTVPAAKNAMNALALGPSGRLFVAATAALTFAFAPGCVHADAAQDKQIAQLRDELNKDEQERDKAEPTITTSDQPLIDPRDAKGKSPPPEAEGPKDLRVLQAPKDVGDDSGEPSESEDPDDATPRPTIRVAGAPQPSRTPARTRGGKEQITAAFPDDDGTTRSPVAAGPEARAAYDAARNLMTQRKYKEALDGLTAFLVKWPDHPMADNAMFWRGDCYYQLGDFTHAEQELAGALSRFPQGVKAPDTLLKLGMTEEKLGQPDKARGYYDTLLRDFPKSDAARRIPASGGAGPKGPKENR